MTNRAERRQLQREEKKAKEPKKFFKANEPTRAKQRSLLKMMRQPTKPIKKYMKLSKKLWESIKDTIGLGTIKSYGYPTRKSTGRKPFGA